MYNLYIINNIWDNIFKAVTNRLIKQKDHYGIHSHSPLTKDSKIIMIWKWNSNSQSVK